MLITAISAAPRRTGRFDVAIDGKHAATLSIEAIDRLQLALGVTVDERLEAALAREANIVRVYDRALNMIALRARASSELRRSLIRKGEEAEYVDVAVDRLVRAGFLDDSSFAKQFTRNKVAGAGLSRRRVQQELARRGVSREIAESAIAEVFVEENVDEEDTIERVARKKLKTLARFEPAVQRRRLYAFLARRGFQSEDIARTMRGVMSEAEVQEESRAE